MSQQRFMDTTGHVFTAGSQTSDLLSDLVRRILAVVQPEKNILFGSAARGEISPDSDLDVLVVKSGVHRRRTAQAIYRNLVGLGRAVDVIVVTPEDIERYGHCPALVIESALRDGKIIYAA